MSARLLEHVNIRTTRLQETVRFYVEVLGLQRGDYPGKTVPGAWIYDAQGVPVVHIVGIDPFDEVVQQKADRATLPRPLASLNGTGVIDHVAFAAVDYDAFVQRIKGLNLPYRTRDAMAGLRQIYVIDPNDVLIELNFHESVEKGA
jgi:catechol 2,3-dioxygenase-like lactoylglutathione lyase family enzyme